MGFRIIAIMVTTTIMIITMIMVTTMIIMIIMIITMIMVITIIMVIMILMMSKPNLQYGISHICRHDDHNITIIIIRLCVRVVHNNHDHDQDHDDETHNIYIIH